MAESEYDLLDILEALGLSESDRKKQRSIESRLHTLRKGLTAKRKRRDGTYYDNPVTIEPQLLEGQHWYKKGGKGVRYTKSGYKKALEILGEGE
jgi:hypothetical protein